MTHVKDIYNRVLKQRGIQPFKEQGKQTRLRKIIPSIIPASSKTPMMRYFEIKTGLPIERILLSGSLSKVVELLDGEVDTSTISKWIKRLKLKYTPNNLPKCGQCIQASSMCDAGACQILVDMELYNLLPLKRKELFDEEIEDPNLPTV